MITQKNIPLFSILLFFQIIHPHGFGENTSIQINQYDDYLRVGQVYDLIADKQSFYTSSYDESKNRITCKKIKSAGVSQTDYYCRLEFNYSAQNHLLCTPLQLFYRISDQAWIAAYKLNVGDRLLCADNQTVIVSDVALYNETLTVYTLEIKNTHIFLVTRHKILAHNMLIALGCVATTFALPAEIGCGATIGAALGPVGACTGAVLSGVLGCIINAYIKDHVVEYALSYSKRDIARFEKNITTHHNDKQNDDAQAPGKPTENDGFIPKKNWDGKKVRHPKTGAVGWPDKDGNIWKPTGPGSSAHGGPHWDVTSQDGKRHWNIMPGGKERGSK